ncbi:hypothetical protein LCGC14_2945710, partial [marine sediment metagenome]
HVPKIKEKIKDLDKDFKEFKLPEKKEIEEKPNKNLLYITYML